MKKTEKAPIILKDMGSMDFGGRVTIKENGDTFHGDHGYAQYFVPQDSTDYPVIFWHGYGQSGRCWESTADGRDGFWQMFSRKKIPTYIIDQPRRGRASYTDAPVQKEFIYPILKSESECWLGFRNGDWFPPEPMYLHKGSAVPATPTAVDHFFRMQCADNVGEPPTNELTMFLADSVGDLIKQAGKSVLFTHSISGGYGWATGCRYSDDLKAIYSYEPGRLIFPDDFELEPIESPWGTEQMNAIMQPPTLPREEWLNLTKVPIRIYYGDYISEEPSSVYGEEVFRFSVYRCRQFAQLLNENGGDVKVIMLPELGITGNGHAGMSDLNNEEIAELIFKDMEADGLLTSEKHYDGPVRKEVADYPVAFGGEK